jgi:transposase
MGTSPKVASEMALHVLAYKLERVRSILGIQPLLEALRGRGGALLASPSL